MRPRPPWAAVGVGASVSLAAVVALLAVGVLVRQDARRGRAAEIRAEFAVVAEAQKLLPMVSAAAIIDRLSREGGTGAYLLQQPDGRRIAGNLSAPPVLRQGADGLLTGRTADRRALVAGRRVLDGGFPLTIGRWEDGSGDAPAVALAAFAATAAALIALTAALSWRGEARVLARVREIDAALEAVRAGDLSGRAPAAGGLDPVDILARHINSTLERLEELAQQHRSTGQFIAHELHRPLADACRRLDAMHSDAPAILGARANLQRLSEAFDALMELSELRGDQPLERRSVQLDALAREAVTLYAPTAAAWGIELAADLGPAPLSGSLHELRSLVVNLLDNAVKYTAQGSVRVSTGVRNGGAWMRVEDRGPGMAGFPAEPGRLFARGAAARREDGGDHAGLGLGLSLVRQVARRHGAQVSWRDREDGGGGTQVEVVFATDLSARG